MTAPTGGAGTTTTPFTINPAAPPAPLTDTGNSPVGMALVNRGDNGQTVYVMAGPAGQAGAVPLGPGGSITWQTADVIPFAYLGAGATKPETILLTNQSADYSNPAAVAAATATQLAAQGVPNFLTGQVVYTVNDGPGNNSSVSALARGAVSPVLDVSKYSSLIIRLGWFSPGDVGQAALRFDFGYANYYALGNSAIQSPDAVTFTCPVVGPTLTLTNKYAALNWITVYGTNRPAPGNGLQHIPDPSTRQFTSPWTGNPVTGTIYGTSPVDGQSTLIRMIGRAKMIFSSPSGGTGPLFVDTVSPFGGTIEYPLVSNNAYGQVFEIGMPASAPVWVRYRSDAAATGSLQLNIAPS